MSADQERRQLRAAVRPDCHVAVFETVGQRPWHVDPRTRWPHLVDDEVPADGLAQFWLGEWPWPEVGIGREGVGRENQGKESPARPQRRVLDSM